jgi:hypothetical protein
MDSSTAEYGGGLMERKNLGGKTENLLLGENPEKKTFRGGIQDKDFYFALLIGQEVFLVKILKRRMGG